MKPIMPNTIRALLKVSEMKTHSYNYSIKLSNSKVLEYLRVSPVCSGSPPYSYQLLVPVIKNLAAMLKVNKQIRIIAFNTTT